MNSQDYTFIQDLPQDPYNRQPPPQQQFWPTQQTMQQPYTPEYQMLSTSDSESDTSSESESEDNTSGKGLVHHLYSLVTLVFLVIILIYVLKIKKELAGMYMDEQM